MSLHNCYVTIDNTNNSYPLTLSAITYQKGTFSNSSIKTGMVIAAKATFSFNINASEIGYGADGTIQWTTGPSGAVATITTNFQNVLTGSNEADISVTGNAAAMMAYGGVSYLCAASGSGNVLSRDTILDNGSYPLYINFYIVRNSFVDTPASYLPGVNNVVMLMLENRSLDHLLGAIYAGSAPTVVYPEGSPANYEGVPAGFSNSDGTNTVPVFPINQSANPDTPDPDPGETWENVNVQVYYPGTPSDAPTMGGFLLNYEQQGISEQEAQQIMGYYTTSDLPVISNLALDYAICDEWFCSVPTQTYANRAFSIAGTSEGEVDNQYISPFECRTMFNVLSDSGDNDWAIYYQDSWITGTCFTTFQFSEIGDDPLINESARVQPFDNFLTAAQNGTLPAFSYLEPAWYEGPLGNGNDYHPPGNIAPGEQMLAQVYKALTSNQQAWANTLFIITFDEHGGTFDHVSPQGTVTPDGQTYSGSGGTFDFTTLGVRVPTIMVSPLIASGMVFRAPNNAAPYFDHTSFVRSILGWRGIDVSGGVMGARAAQAPDFSGILSSGAVNAAVRKYQPKPISEAAKAASMDVPLNDLQRAMMATLAYSITGGEKGGREHLRVWQEMKAKRTKRELYDYMVKARAQQLNKQ